MSMKKILLVMQNQCWRHKVRWVHASRKAAKKKYKYDLDNLIDWKKETHLAFGSPRKPTKTGKLKKTKKTVSPEIEEQLQILSSISLSTADQNEKDLSEAVILQNLKDVEVPNNCYDIVVPDHVLASSLPPADSIPLSRHTEYSFKSKVFEPWKSSDNYVPNEVFDSLAEFQDAELIFKPTGAKLLSNDEETRFPEKNSADGIYIPKIAPVPTIGIRSSSQQSMTVGSDPSPNGQINETHAINSEYLNVGIPMTTSLKKNQQMERYSSVQPQDIQRDINQNVERTKKTSIASAVKSSNIASNSSQNEILAGSEEELEIPRNEPVPDGTITFMPQKSQSYLGFSSRHPFASTAQGENLPFEAPDSFDIVPKIPLFPREKSEWQGGMVSEKFASFKMDVEQMFTRVLPSVKTILNKTMPELNKYFLNRWREGMINELGEEGFKKHQDATIKRGVNLHANIMEYLSGKPLCELQIMPDNEGHWASLQTALTTVSDVKALEVEILHSILLYRGVFDCVARYKDLLCVIDWKTSKKPKPLLKNAYDDPVQIAAYLGALNSREDYVAQYGQVNCGMLVVAYPDGSPAHVHMMNRAVCEQYWQDWLDRLHNFYQLTYTEKSATKKMGITGRV